MVDAHQWLPECGFVLMTAYPYPYAYAPNVISRYIPVSFILDIDDFFFCLCAPRIIFIKYISTTQRATQQAVDEM